jgi:hypothetical protein
MEQENPVPSMFSPAVHAAAAEATELVKQAAAKIAKQPNIFFISFILSSD